MGTVQVAPNTTIEQGTWTRTGGTTVHGVLSDNDDATYMVPGTVTNDGLYVGFATPTGIPAGARITNVSLILRVNEIFVGGGAELFVGVDTATKGSGAQAFFQWEGGPVSSAAAQYTAAPDGSRWDTADLVGLSSLVYFGGGDPGSTRVLDEDIRVTYDEIPVVTVTAPPDEDTATAGTQVTSTSTPSAGWTFADPEGSVQERWRVRRYLQPTAGWTGFDPDTTTEVPVETRTGVGTGTSTAMTTVLTNGATYRDYVSAADPTPTGFPVRYSAWAFREYTLALTPPPPPAIVVTPDAVLNRVGIALTAGTGTPTTELFTVERSDDGETTWSEIRPSPVTNTGGTVTVYDYEAPRSSDGTDQPIVYRARAVDTTTGNAVYSAAVQSNTVNLLSDSNAWLKSTSDSSLNMKLSVNATPTIDSESEEPQSVYYAQGRFYPTVHSADIRAERFPLQVSFTDDAEREAFEALRALQESLLLQLCTGDDGLEQYYVRLGGMRLWKRVIDPTQNTNQGAIYTITATEVGMP